MKIVKLGVAVIAGFVSVAAMQSPVLAASPMNEAFLANVKTNVAFLDRSSRLAADHAAGETMRAFARSEAKEQVVLASKLNEVSPAAHRLAATDRDGVQTGRSVAVAASVTQAPVTDIAANGRSPLGHDELALLGAASGQQFDDLYWQTQLDALSQIESDYRTYIANGENPALIALAKAELPKVMHRLAMLTRI